MRAHGVALGALLLSLGGCSHAPPTDDLAPVRKLAETRLGTHLQETGNDIALPEGELDVVSALRLALARNPELQAKLAEVGVARAELAAASTFPNPVLGLVARLPDRPPSAANIEFDVLGNLLDLLLRPQRIAGQQIALDETILAASGAMLGLAAETEVAYLTAIADRAKLRTLRKLQRQAVEDCEATARLRETGTVSASALLRAEAVVAEHRVAVLEAEQSATASRAQLSRLLALNGNEADTLRLPRRLPNLPAAAPVVSAPDTLAITQRPEIAAARKSIERQALARQIALDWRWLPSLQGGLAGERTSERGLALGPRVEIGLPLFDHGEPRLARLGAELLIAQQRLAGRVLEVEAEARVAASAVARRHAVAQLQQETLAPLRRRVLEVAGQLRALGAVSADELGLARQEYLRATSARLDALRDYWLAEAALRRAVGGTLVPAQTAP